MGDDTSDFAQRVELLEIIDAPRATAVIEEPVIAPTPIEIDHCSACGLIGHLTCPRCRLGAAPDDVIDHVLADVPPCAPPLASRDTGERLRFALAEFAALLGQSAYISVQYEPHAVAAIVAAGGQHERSWYGAERQSYMIASVYMADGGGSVTACSSSMYGPPPPKELDASRSMYPDAWAGETPQ